jgi:predicted nuclease of predicted toxin-antitoxin system
MTMMTDSSTFFIDRCLGSKRIAQVLRDAGLTVATHEEHFEPDALDVDWLPDVGDRGWVVLTKDANISKNQLERMAVTRSEVRMFILASQNLSGAEMAEIFQRVAVTLQSFSRNHPEPFIAKVYKDGRVEMWRDRDSLLAEFGTG